MELDNQTLSLLSQQAKTKEISLISVVNAQKDGEVKRFLKVIIHFWILILLTAEIVFLIYIIISQGIGRLAFTADTFKLSEWAFCVFSSSCLAQTFFTLRPIVNHLFPTRLNDNSEQPLVEAST